MAGTRASCGLDGRRVPQQGAHGVADVAGELGHLGGLGIVAEERVRLRGGQGSGPLERGLGAVLAHRQPLLLRPVERRRVGVVAGEEADVVLDQEVVVRVVLGELPLDVALGVVGEVLDELVVAAVDLVGVPSLAGDVLLVGVAPAVRTGVVGEGIATRRLARRQHVSVRVDRITEVLQVLHVHRLGELDGVVVTERALDRDGELEVVAGDVGVEVVEPVEERPVPRHLVDVLVGHVDEGDVVDPPPVVLGELGPERGLGVHVPIALVLGTRFGDLGGDRAQLQLHRRRLPGSQSESPAPGRHRRR